MTAGRTTRHGVALAAALLLATGCSSLEGLFDFSFLDGWFSGGGESATAGASVSGSAPVRPELEELAETPPRLAVGDRFSFDNPAVTWKVERIEGERIFWRADSGDEQVTGLNPVLPALAWRSAGQGRGRRLITDMSAPFFPLRVGKRLTFKSTVSTDTPPYAWEFTWTCEMLGTETVAVTAGRFETYRIQCGRQRPDELTFSYAPRVGHYVRMVSRPGAGTDRVTRELTDFRSRNYIAYVDPMTTAMAEGDGDGMAAAPTDGAEARSDGMDAAKPARPPAMMMGAADDESTGRDGGRVSMVPLPELDNPMDKPDPRFDTQDGPMMVLPDGQAPRSGLSGEGRARQQQQQQQPQRTTTTAPAESQAAASAPPESLPGASVADGAAALHLASYKNPANAETGWKQLSSANADLLGAQRPIVRKVDLAGKGIFYRLHAGPVASMDDAKALCAALKARDVYCAPKQL